MSGLKGISVLKFQEIGNDSDTTRMYVDEVSLYCDFIQRNPEMVLSIAETAKIAISVVTSGPFHHLRGV